MAYTITMPILTLPSGRLSLATNYAHLPSFLESLVQERLLVLDGVSIPVKIGNTLHNNAHSSPLFVPSNVVAVLIRQPEIPATFRVEESEFGYIVEERTPSKPEEYYLLFNRNTDGRTCTIEALVEVRYFYIADQLNGNSDQLNGNSDQLNGNSDHMDDDSPATIYP
ncbi:hypothetical protein BDR22DRAFT_907146 [Usnea florida]